MRIIKYVLKVRILENVKKGERTEDTQTEAVHFETGGTMRAQFITASEVAEIMGISRSKAYQIVREMNLERIAAQCHQYSRLRGERSR